MIIVMFFLLLLKQVNQSSTRRRRRRRRRRRSDKYDDGQRSHCSIILELVGCHSSSEYRLLKGGKSCENVKILPVRICDVDYITNCI
jgi:hypothetical protein